MAEQSEGKSAKRSFASKIKIRDILHRSVIFGKIKVDNLMFTLPAPVKVAHQMIL